MGSKRGRPGLSGPVGACRGAMGIAAGLARRDLRFGRCVRSERAHVDLRFPGGDRPQAASRTSTGSSRSASRQSMRNVNPSGLRLRGAESCGALSLRGLQQQAVLRRLSRVDRLQRSEVTQNWFGREPISGGSLRSASVSCSRSCSASASRERDHTAGMHVEVVNGAQRSSHHRHGRRQRHR